MNKKLIWVITALVIAIGAGAIYYFFVKDRSQHLKYIPKDVTLAVHCDLKSLKDKSDFDKVMKMKFFIKFMDDQSRNSSNHEFTDVLLKKPLSTGIDLLSDPVFFMSNRNDKTFAGLSFKLSSSGEFNRFIKKYKTSNETKKSDTYTSLELEDDDVFIAWNDEAAVVLSSPNSGYGSSRVSKAELEKVLDIYMTQITDESLAANEDYKSFRKEKQDIGLFVAYDKLFDLINNNMNSNAYRYYDGDMSNTKAQLEKMKDRFKGVKLGCSLLFENNAINGRGTMYGENTEKLLEQYGFTGKSLSDDLIKTISNEQVLATLFFNYSTDKMFDAQMENPIYKSVIEKFAEEMNMTVGDLKSILGGEMALSLVDAEVIAEENKYEDIDPETEEIVTRTRIDETPMPYFTFAFEVKNENNFQNLMDQINNKMSGVDNVKMEEDRPTPDVPVLANAIEKRGSNYYFKRNNIEINMIKTAKGYTVTNSPKVAEALTKNGSLSADPKLINKEYFSNNSAGFKIILDLEKYPKPVITYLKKQTGEKSPIWNVLKNFKDLSGQVPTGDKFETDFSLNMVEGKGNSLYRLLEMIDEAN